ncbi:unnamed protein product [Adineta steineri]|uniref:Type VII secretion system protein EssD-like domain-containing protein n=1 Tax=Adineta steineri TaxID=433720 RepID=A0A814Q303_9BILA|nr:unnamed protein product [Adineta steineri]CAF1177600.1 unnamed protein product [Adineta steineri]
MWKSLTIVLLSFIIGETFCGPVRRKDPNKIHSLNSLCHILNYGEFNDRGIKTFTLNNPNEPIKKYQTGYKNRVEYVRAVITVQTVQSKGSTTNDATRKFARAMGKLTDDAGHIIGNNLGGTGRNVYNIFPQSPNINRGAWSQEEKDIRNLVLTTKQPIEVVVQLYYPTTTATRPNRFTYRAAYNNACHSANVINP